MDVQEEIDVLHGVGLAHTSLVAALIAVLREKKLLTQDEVNHVFDVALVGAENSAGMRTEAHNQARQIIEIIANQMGGKAARDDRSRLL